MPEPLTLAVCPTTAPGLAAWMKNRMRMLCTVSAAVAVWLLGSACHGADAPGTPRSSGLVGLRILPHDAAQAKQEWLSGIGNYKDIEGQYPFVAENLDVIWGPRGCFKTDRAFFEWYVEGDGGEKVNPDPKTSELVKYLRRAEQSGLDTACGPPPTNAVNTSPQVVDYILICRETGLSKQGRPGPFAQDPRILHPEDVNTLRQLFRDAHAAGLLKHDNYRLIQLVQHPSFFAENPEAQKVMRSMDGVVYEAHHFNPHWPLDTGWSRPELVVRGAKWTLAEGKEYIFYYGPFRFKEFEGYHEFVDRDWLSQLWKAGLPKRDPRMHYFINAFPHAGCKRPVGPESDPHSNLGMTRWLIEELRAGPNPKGESAKPSTKTE